MGQIFLAPQTLEAGKKCVLITGGGGYLGHRIAQSLAKEGFDCLLYDLREPSKQLTGVIKKTFLLLFNDETCVSFQQFEKSRSESWGNLKFIEGDVCNLEKLR